MKTNRRGFLGRLGAIAAAVVAVEAAPKVVEAGALQLAADEGDLLWHGAAVSGAGSGWTEARLTFDPDQYVIIPNRITAATSGNGIYITRSAPTNPLRVTDGRGTERAVVYGFDPATLYLRAGEFTAVDVNEWMTMSGAQCIVGAGVDETVIYGPESVVTPAGASFMHYEAAPLPPRGEQIRAEGYADGYTQATQRARSRIDLGLEV